MYHLQNIVIINRSNRMIKTVYVARMDRKEMFSAFWLETPPKIGRSIRQQDIMKKALREVGYNRVDLILLA